MIRVHNEIAEEKRKEEISTLNNFLINRNEKKNTAGKKLCTSVAIFSQSEYSRNMASVVLVYLLPVN